MTTKIIAVVNGKGGVAKTTTAFNLAAIYSRKHEVLLVDSDPQGSATAWASRGEQPFVVARESNPEILAQLKKVDQYDLIICDTPPNLGSDTLSAIVSAADYVVLPTPPSLMDLIALMETVTTSIAPTQVKHRVVLTKVDPRRMTDAVDVQESLRADGIPVCSSIVRLYAGHEKSVVDGVSILAWKGKNAKEAGADYKNVADELQREWN